MKRLWRIALVGLEHFGAKFAGILHINAGTQPSFFKDDLRDFLTNPVLK
jgi:hypothetical protein